MQRTHTSRLSRPLSCNLYGTPLAQLQRQREVGTFGSGPMELDWPRAPAHAQLLSGTAGLGDTDLPISHCAGTQSARAAGCRAANQN